jgi:nucleotide-binding universal stress UspA family protein
MNPIRQIVAHVSDSPRSAAVLRTAAALAARHDAKLQALYAVDAVPPGAYLSAEASALAAGLLQQAVAERRAAAEALVRDTAAALGLPPAALPLRHAEGDALQALLAASRTADLLVLGQHDPADPGGVGARLAGRLLVGAGCPLLWLPHAMEAAEAGFAGAGGDTDPAACGGGRVLVAWAATRESARALRDALPWLQHAAAVEVLHCTGPADDAATAGAEAELAAVVAHLQRHGVAATGRLRHAAQPSVLERLHLGWTPDAPVAEALLSHAADCGADVLVMGGYGHPRAWELALGGVTRTILQSMTLPVLMSH